MATGKFEVSVDKINPYVSVRADISVHTVKSLQLITHNSVTSEPRRFR